MSLADYMLHRPRSSWLHKNFPWETNDLWLDFRHGQEFFIFPNVQTEFGAQPASY
jgi:hypothetical protein